MNTYTMIELEAQSGIPARTIRYYVASNLLPGPVRQGPGAPYTEDHLAILKRIKELQREGKTLDSIRQILSESPMSLQGYPAQVFGVTDGVEVRVDSRLPPRRKHIIFRALETFTRAVRTTIDVEEREDDNA